MRSLEVAAAATVGISTIPFLAAWDAAGQAGRKYRETVNKFLNFGTALLVVPLGILCGLLARIAAPLDPRTPDSQKGLKSYIYRRNYRGRHYSGRSVARTIHALAS
jgi:hypothetical protein